jgi:hypothetical protein
MVVDHIKYSIPSLANNFTLYFGRISFPLYVFCAVEGYNHTSNFKKYLLRIFILAIISQIPYMFFISLPTLNKIDLNVVFTLFFGLVSIKFYEIADNKFLKYFCVLSIGILASILKVDYGIYGVMLMFVLYLFKDNKVKQALGYILVVTVRYLIRIWYYQTGFTLYMRNMWLCSLIPLIFILLYNGKQGPRLKKFYYYFYPIHILLLYLISPFTGIFMTFG